MDDLQEDVLTTSQHGVKWTCARLQVCHRTEVPGKHSRLAPTANWLWDKEEEEEEHAYSLHRTAQVSFDRPRCPRKPCDQLVGS